jgi:hypothetical protein
VRRLQPGMCAVFVRKRPMFQQDMMRSNYDVLTVIRSECQGDGPPVIRDSAPHLHVRQKHGDANRITHTDSI